MFPAHVRGLEDALWEMRSWVSTMGALSRSLPDPVRAEFSGDQMVAVLLEPVTMHFPDGRRLVARIIVGRDLQPFRYKFNLLDGSRHLWAYHWHPGHEELGGLAHAHLTEGNAAAVHPHGPVDLSFIRARVHGG